ncbi:MAG: molybdenum ABC transporter ATP-binding protein [Chlorobiaceae bacterium]|jgi:molybdate transport system ATP-binding protein|nr:molybdenum ABC transporter ATP-binding protein [Chlorobiaceae bacterium]NTV16807.1 molybdenum ABC transporter ATP-binding protein [Chlorobiaceae bacterium]
MKLYIDVEKKLGEFSLQVKADVSGERTGIFGESGSGKSTLVHLISGLMQPDKGEIVLDETCLFSSRKKINLAPEERRIAIVFQQAMLFPHMSVKKNLFYGYKRCHSENRRIKAETLIDLLKLQPLLQRGVKNLSGGEKQRVALGRAILANPRLLLMDEPLSALDDRLRFQIIPYLRSVSEEFRIPYLFISHSLTEMQLMTDHILAIKNGRCMEETTPEQLARNWMAQSPKGYLNLLRLADPVKQNGLFAYRWGKNTLLVSGGDATGESLFELSSREIILFKKHPEAISARNLLDCTVTEMFESDGRIGIVLSVNGEKLVAEIVRSAAEELHITIHSTLFAAIKASSFRMLA